jgi:L-asparaginase type I
VLAAARGPAETLELREKAKALMTQTLRETPSGQPHDEDCSVGLVLTGGTIGAQETDSVLSVRGDADQPEVLPEVGLLASVWPGPDEPHIVVESPLRLLSENIHPRDWVAIAEAVRSLVESRHVAGVVILHGTDTMAYTAAALSFLLSDIDRPIVLTGSNLPTEEAGSDAAKNVQAALVALQALQSGTYVAFAGGRDLLGRVYLGTRIRKRRASGEAFMSVNRDLVGVVEDGRFQARTPYIPERHDGFAQEIDDRVLALRLYPGLDFDAAFESVAKGDIHGVVIELYASGTGPDTDDRFSLPRFIEKCVETGVVVATAVAEATNQNGKTYETTLAIKNAGGVFLGDMLAETASVKLMWALAQTSEMKAVQELLLRPIAGELEPQPSH